MTSQASALRTSEFHLRNPKSVDLFSSYRSIIRRLSQASLPNDGDSLRSLTTAATHPHLNGRSIMTKHSVLAGFALATVVALGSLCSATDHPVSLNQGAEAGVPAADAPRQIDEVAWRIRRLAESLEQSRAAAEKNPLLLADVGYYEAELAATRGAQLVTAR
jgi:hypothetical protein